VHDPSRSENFRLYFYDVILSGGEAGARDRTLVRRVNAVDRTTTALKLFTASILITFVRSLTRLVPVQDDIA
jgi:hypothetical protein